VNLRRRPPRRRFVATGRTAQRGVTLVETVLVIVIGGIVLASIAGAIAWAAGRSGDSWPLKQALAVAESLMGEVALKPYGACDADSATPAAAGSCTLADGPGPEPGEARSSYTAPFDHPNDYDGFAMAAPAGITKLDGTAVAGLEAYGASVSVQPQALDGVPADRGLWVSVTVTGPAGTAVRLQSFRARLSP
jgi:MSHA pilin protein MshD